MKRRLATLACLALATHAIAATAATAGDCTATAPPTGELIGTGLLDPNTPEPERQRLTQLLTCTALAGNANSMDVAGSLYRWGPRHPAHVFPEDHDKARDLFTAAASHGRRSAMLKLAELELADGHAREAMVWFQIENAYFMRGNGTPGVGDAQKGAGYYTMLLKRITDALGPFDEQALIRDVNGRMAALDRQMAANPPRPSTGPGLGKVHMPAQARLGTTTKSEKDDGAFAQYFIEVSPDGSITRRWLIDAYPDPASGMRLARALDQTRFDALPPGNKEMRYALMPVSLRSIHNGVQMQKP
jgi:TPR repeat protein